MGCPPRPPAKMENGILTIVAVNLAIQVTASAQVTITSQEALARAAFYRANQEYQSGEYDNAVADYSEAIRLKSDYPSAFNNRGATYDQLKQYDKAIADFTEAI